jgi:hypothetical protein
MRSGLGVTMFIQIEENQSCDLKVTHMGMTDHEPAFLYKTRKVG